MTEVRAEQVYCDYYETPRAPLFKTIICRIEPQLPATKLYDAAVNMGFQRAGYLFQLALLDCGASLVPDGFFGSQSLEATNKADPQRLVNAYCDHLVAHYKTLAVKNPKLAKFLNGWLDRAKWGQHV
jgi:lysozyme family protein